MLFKDLNRLFISGNIELWFNQQIIYFGSVWDWTTLSNWGECRVIGVMASLTISGTVIVIIKEVE